MEVTHDKYLKILFSDKENVRVFLSQFFPDIAKYVDLTSIEPQPTEAFLVEPAERLFLDFVINCKLNNIESKIYIIFEHKSSPDKRVFIQIAKYILSIWEKEIMNNSDTLTPIIPIVVYNGSRNWNIPTNAKDHFKDLPEELLKYILNFEYILFDVKTLNNDVITSLYSINQKLAIGFEAMKPIPKELARDILIDIANMMVKLIEKYKQNPSLNIDIFIEYTISYLQVKANFTEEEFKALAKEVQEMKSIVEVFREEGIEIGKKEDIIKLHTKGSMSAEDIAYILDLPLDFVKETLKKNGFKVD